MYRKKASVCWKIIGNRIKIEEILNNVKKSEEEINNKK